MGITIMELDVTDITAIRHTRDQIAIATGGKLNILVNNAGQAYPVAVTDMDMSQVRALFEVNLFAPMCMVQEFIYLLMGSARLHECSCIVNIGSISGMMPVPFSAAYNASKSALHSFNNTIRIELAPFKIKVTNVLTGGVKSNISRPHAMSNDSLYKGMEDLYQTKRANASQSNAMPTDQYASRVVSEIMKTNPRAWLWVGQNALLVWFMDTFLGRTAFDYLMNKTFGMNEFADRISSGKVKVL